MTSIIAVLRTFPDHPVRFFAACFLWVLSITLLRHTPWLQIGSGFTAGMGLLFAALPLLLAALSGRPSFLVTAFAAACIGPFHRVAIVSSLAVGLAMLGRVLWLHRGGVRMFIADAARRRGFGFVLALSGYLTALWLVRLGDSTDVWSLFALSASLLTVPFAIYSLAFLRWTPDEARRAASSVALLLAAEVAVLVLYPALTGQFSQYRMVPYTFQKTLGVYLPLPFAFTWVNPDFNTATFRSAHYASVMAMFFGLGCAVHALYAKRKRASILLAVFALVASAMAENGHALPGLFFAGCVLLLLAGARRHWRPGPAAATVLLGTVASTVLLLLAVYAWTPYFSTMPKAGLYAISLRHIAEHPGRMLLGEGPAAYASQAACKRLPQEMTDAWNFPLMTQHTNAAYARALRASDGPDHFTTLNRPISGLLGLTMEWGLAGTVLVLFTLYRLLRMALRTFQHAAEPLLRAAALSAVAAFIILFIANGFRPYFEYPDLMCLAGLGFLLTVVSPQGEGGSREWGVGSQSKT